jgi:hypothetical protein
MMIFSGTAKVLSLVLLILVWPQTLAGMLIKSINTMDNLFMLF